MFVTSLFEVRPQHLRVDRVPPTVRAPDDRVQVVGIAVHVVLFAVFTDSQSNLIF